MSELLVKTTEERDDLALRLVNARSQANRASEDSAHRSSVIASCEVQLKQLEGKLKDCMLEASKVPTLEAEILRLRLDLSPLKQEVVDREQKVRDLTESLQICEDALLDLQAAYAALETRRDAEMKNLSLEASRLHVELNESRVLSDNLLSKKKSLEASLEAVKNSNIKANTASLEELKVLKEKLNEVEEQRIKETGVLRIQMNVAKAAETQVTQQLAMVEQARKEENERHTNALSTLQKELNTLNLTIEQMQAEFAGREELLRAEALKLKDQTQSTVEAYVKETTELRESISALEKDHAQEMQDLRHKFSENENAHASELKSLQESTCMQIETHQKELNSLRERLSALDGLKSTELDALKEELLLREEMFKNEMRKTEETRKQLTESLEEELKIAKEGAALTESERKRLYGELQSVLSQLLQKEIECSSYTKENAALLVAKDALQATIEDLSQTIDSLKESSSSLNSGSALLEDRLTTAQQQLESVDAELEDTRAALETAREAICELEAVRNALECESRNLEWRFEDEKVQREVLQCQVNDANARNCELEERLSRETSTLRISLEMQTEEASQLSSQLIESKNQVTEIADRLSNTENLLQSYKSETIELSTQLNSVTGELKISQSNIEVLKGKLEVMQREKDHLDDSTVQQTAVIVSFKNQISNLELDISTAKEEISRLSIEIQTTQKDAKLKDESLSSCIAQLSDSTAKVESLTSALSEQTQSSENAKCALENSEIQLKSSILRLEEATTKLTAFESELITLHEQMTNTNEEMDILKKRKHELENLYSNECKKSQHLQVSVDELREKYATLHADLCAERELISVLEENLITEKNKVENLQSELSTIQIEAKAASQDLLLLSSNLALEKSKTEDLTAQFNRVQNHANNLSSELNSLRDDSINNNEMIIQKCELLKNLEMDYNFALEELTAIKCELEVSRSTCSDVKEEMDIHVGRLEQQLADERDARAKEVLSLRNHISTLLASEGVLNEQITQYETARNEEHIEHKDIIDSMEEELRKLSEEVSLEKAARIAAENSLAEMKVTMNTAENARVREVSCLKGALDVAKTRSNTEVSRLAAELDTMTNELTNTKQVLENVKAEYQTHQEEHHKTIATLEAELQSKDLETEKLQVTIDQSKSRSLVEAEQIQQLSAVEVSLRSKIASLESELKTSNHVTAEFKSSKEKLDQTTANLISQLEEKENMLSTLKKSTDDLRKNSYDQTSFIKALEDRTKELENQNLKSNKALIALEEAYDALKEERDGLFNGTSELKRRVGQVERSGQMATERHRAELESEKQRLEALVFAAEKDHVVTRNQLSETKRTLEHTIMDLKQREIDISKLRMNLGDQEGNSSGLKMALKDAETSLSLERNKLEKMEFKMANVEKDLAAALARIADVESRRIGFERESNRLKTELSTAKDTLKSLKIQNEEIQMKLKKTEPLAAQVVLTEKENEILSQRLAENEQWIMNLNRQNAAAELALRSNESQVISELKRLLPIDGMTIDCPSPRLPATEQHKQKVKYLDSLKTQIVSLTTEIHDQRRKLGRLRVVEEEIKVFTAFLSNASGSSGTASHQSKCVVNSDVSSRRGGALIAKNGVGNASVSVNTSNVAVESLENKRLRRDAVSARADLMSVAQLVGDLLALLAPSSSIEELQLKGHVVDAEAALNLADNLRKRLSTSVRGLIYSSSLSQSTANLNVVHTSSQYNGNLPIKQTTNYNYLHNAGSILREQSPSVRSLAPLPLGFLNSNTGNNNYSNPQYSNCNLNLNALTQISPLPTARGENVSIHTTANQNDDVDEICSQDGNNENINPHNNTLEFLKGKLLNPHHQDFYAETPMSSRSSACVSRDHTPANNA